MRSLSTKYSNRTLIQQEFFSQDLSSSTVPITKTFLELYGNVEHSDV